MKKQKILCLGLAALLLAGIASAGSTLILDEEDGLAERCEVESYDGRKETVKVRCVLGVTRRPLSGFSEINQKKIFEWVADEIFSSSRLHVRINKERGAWKTPNGEVEQITYVVEFENRGSIPVADVNVKSTVFYEKQKSRKADEKRKATRKETLTIQPFEKKMLKSQIVQLRDEIKRGSGGNSVTFSTPSGGSVELGSSGTPSTYYKDKLEGVLLCISREDRFGKIVKREYKQGRVPKEAKRTEYKEEQQGPLAFRPSPAQKDGFKKRVLSEMALVGAGTFRMGSGDPRDISGHPVTLSTFEMGAYEITTKEIARVLNWAFRNNRIKIGYSGSRAIEVRSPRPPRARKFLDLRRGGCKIKFSEKKQIFEVLPLVREYATHGITWYGAATYCNLRSEMEGLEPCYDAKKDEWTCDFESNGYRLPTEAEWEYAAKGGHLGQGTVYSGGDDINQVAKYDDRLSQTRFQRKGFLVGERRPNELGLFDMSGNVAEWCFDWYDEYETKPQKNPVQTKFPKTKNSSVRVRRGGHLKGLAEECRVTARSKGHPEEDTAGFRVVRSVLLNEE